MGNHTIVRIGKKFLLTFLTLLALLFTLFISPAEARWDGGTGTGPGGVGSTNGAAGLELWLMADQGVTNTGNGTPVTAWADQSGNPINCVPGNAPIYQASIASINNLPSVLFNGTSNNLNCGNNLNLTRLNVFAVVIPQGNSVTTADHKIVAKGFNGTLTPWELGVAGTVGRNTFQRFNPGGAVGATSATAFVAGTPVIVGGSYNGSNWRVYHNSNASGGPTADAIGPGTTAVALLVGAVSNNGTPVQFWNGHIAEVIAYDRTLNDAERILVDNYLSSKYNIALAANDHYAGDAAGTDYDLDVAGIGVEASGSNNEAHSAGLVIQPSGGSLDTNGEYVLAGHASSTNGYTAADVPASIQNRWTRIWYVDQTGAVDVVLSFDFSEGGVAAPGGTPTYSLLYRAGTAGAFTNLGLAGTVVGDQVQFTVASATLADGFYTLGYTLQQPPTAANNTVTTLEDTSYTFAAADFNYNDPNGDPFGGIQITSLAGLVGTLQYNLAPATTGVLYPDVTQLVFSPDPDANGTSYASFDFQVYDGTQYSLSSYTMTIDVTAVNDEPAFTASDPPSVPEDAPPVTIPNWATFDAGPADEDATQAVLQYIVSNSTCGTLLSAGPAVDAAGTLTYTPALNQTGSCTFDVQVQDNGGTANGGDDTSPAQNFTISVGAVNDPPSVTNLNNDTINYTENDPPTLLDVGSDADVTDPDSADFDTGTLTVQFFANGTADDRLAIQNACGTVPNDISLVGGNVYINAGATLLGSFTGGVGTTPLVVTFGANATPATVDYLLRCISYENVSNTPSTLQRVVQFNVSDGDGGTSASDYAYVNFTGVNDAPVAVGETYATDMDTPLVVAAPGVLANDTDPEGDPLTAVKDSDPANGTLALNADGSFTYTPNLSFSGIDTFTYHANDGTLDSNVVTVNIGVESMGIRLCDSGIFIDKGWEFIFPVGSLPGCIYIYADDATMDEPYSGDLNSLDHRIKVNIYQNGKMITDLNLPYEVCYTLNAEDYKKIGGNFALLRIGVFSNGGSSWELLPVTEKKGKACASLDHFSYFDLFRVALPATGFAPNVVTPLPEQEVAYAPLGDLWLEIPRLGVQQAIVGVPLTENGWDVTWLGDQIGYLYGTAYPTGSGNSVLTAHVYDYNGRPGTFAGLKGLWWGDQVIVHAFGQEYVYEVRQVRQTGWDSAASVLKHEERPWITLVTCKDYDEATNSYRARVVVRAVLVDVK